MFERLFLRMEEANAGAPANAGGGEGIGAPANIGDAPPAATGASGSAIPGTAQPAAGSGGGAAGDGGGNAKSWLESLPEDIRKDPSLQLFKGPEALAKSWVSAQKMIGADKVVIPGEKATEEEIAAFHTKLGRPESADKYEFKLPEGVTLDESMAKSVKEVAFKAGLNPKQLQSLVEWDAQNKIEQAKAAGTAHQTELRGLLDAYKQTLGGDEKFNATVDKARTAVRALAPDEFKAFLRDSGVGSRPEAIAFFAKLADMMGEDKIRDGTGVPFKNEDPHALQKEIEDLEGKMYKDLNSPNMASWVETRSRLYERLHGMRVRT